MCTAHKEANTQAKGYSVIHYLCFNTEDQPTVYCISMKRRKKRKKKTPEKSYWVTTPALEDLYCHLRSFRHKVCVETTFSIVHMVTPNVS